jgi:hypothetical protein
MGHFTHCIFSDPFLIELRENSMRWVGDALLVPHTFTISPFGGSQRLGRKLMADQSLTDSIMGIKPNRPAVGERRSRLIQR